VSACAVLHHLAVLPNVSSFPPPTRPTVTFTEAAIAAANKVDTLAVDANEPQAMLEKLGLKMLQAFIIKSGNATDQPPTTAKSCAKLIKSWATPGVPSKRGRPSIIAAAATRGGADSRATSAERTAAVLPPVDAIIELNRWYNNVVLWGNLRGSHITLTADELVRLTEQESQAFKTLDDLSNSNAAAFAIVKNFGGGIARAPIAGRSLTFTPTLSAVEVSLHTSSLAAASR